MINTRNEFVDLRMFVGMYLTVAVCTRDSYSGYRDQLITEVVPAVLSSFHLLECV